VAVRGATQNQKIYVVYENLGSKQCSFYLHDESIQHLFFDWYYARFIWGLTQIAFSISPPQSMQHMFAT
jgi:hypothetical protein